MTFEEKIAALKSDIAEMHTISLAVAKLASDRNEEGLGGSMLDAISVLLREAIMHYEEEIAILKGPEAA